VPLHADDVLLVVNTVTSSAAFREDESWLPLCLPRFNPKGFLYAHVSFVAPEVCLVLLTAQADGFPQLSACRQQLAAKLQQEGELRSALLRAVGEPQCAAPRRAADARRPGAARAPPARRPRAPCAPPRRRRYTVDAPGVPEVRHFVYRVGEQFTAPRVGVHAGAQCPYRDRAAVKQLMRRYQSVHARVHALPKPLREYLQVTDRETIFAWTSAEYELYVARLGHAPSLTPHTPYPSLSLYRYELYVAFGPLASKPVAVAAAHRLLRWLKKEQPSLFLLHPKQVTT